MVDVRLANAAKSGNVVLVVGTGYSAATTESAGTATWSGLLNAGLDRLSSVSNPALVENLRANLKFGFEEDDLASVLQVADRIRDEFAGVGDAAFAKWLHEDIGLLGARSSDWGDALRALPFPLLTTNYDQLLCTTDRRAVTWRDTAGLQAVMSGASRDIGHLHGVWSDAESVILSGSDYARLLDAEASQVLQRAISTLKSIVYVGYGAGLADPNFSRLIEFHSRHFGAGPVPHFRLCLDDELTVLRGRHLGDHIVPVSYGQSYSELPAFLSELVQLSTGVALTPAGIARDHAGAACLELQESMIADSILAETRVYQEQPSLSEVIMPPILLPAPHAEYVRAQQSETSSTQIERLDP